MAETGYKWPSVGNEKVIKFLESALNNGRVAQTYIFVGADDLGKATMALALAANLQGQPEGFNSDLHILEPEADKKKISIEAVREFIKSLNMSSFSNSYQIGIIKQAELMSAEAKSALLKTLEEPKDKAIIILLTTDEQSLPATIVSRAQVLFFYPVAAGVIYDYLLNSRGVNRSLAKDLSSLALGRPLSAVRMLENPESYKSYLEKAVIWLEILRVNVDERLVLLDKIFSDKTWSKSATETVNGLIVMAESLARDLLLLSLERGENIQHAALKDELEQTLAVVMGDSGSAALLEQFRILATAKEYLSGNVNPRLVLEQVVFNLSV